jgi:hypothetical protein
MLKDEFFLKNQLEEEKKIEPTDLLIHQTRDPSHKFEITS